MAQKSVKRYTALATGVVIISAFAATYALLRPASQPSSPPATTAPVPVRASSGRGGGSKASLPADFPVDFPLPAGTVTGMTGASSTWSVGLNIDGNYASVMPTIRAFYVSHGFTDLNANQAIPFGFMNTNYSLQIVGRNHDHTGPLSTDITIVVHKK